MGTFGNIQLPRGLKIPPVESFTACPPETAPPPDFPDELPFLSDYHCHYGSSTDVSICIWSTGTVEAQDLGSNPVDWLSALRTRRSSDVSRHHTTQAAGARLLEAFTSHLIGRGWSHDRSTLSSLPFPGTVIQARRGSSRIVLVMGVLPDRASLTAYHWKEPSPQGDLDNSGGG